MHPPGCHGPMPRKCHLCWLNLYSHLSFQDHRKKGCYPSKILLKLPRFWWLFTLGNHIRWEAKPSSWFPVSSACFRQRRDVLGSSSSQSGMGKALQEYPASTTGPIWLAVLEGDDPQQPQDVFQRVDRQNQSCRWHIRCTPFCWEQQIQQQGCLLLGRSLWRGAVYLDHYFVRPGAVHSRGDRVHMDRQTKKITECWVWGSFQRCQDNCWEGLLVQFPWAMEITVPSL